jgi:alpha-L-fucosidase
MGRTEKTLNASKLLAASASTDSEQTGNGHALGNDGSMTTRWCAADGALGHYWQVDLGQNYTLGKLQINWEKAVQYQFKVEGSLDGNVWVGILDQTKTTKCGRLDSTLLLSLQARTTAAITQSDDGLDLTPWVFMRPPNVPESQL